MAAQLSIITADKLPKNLSLDYNCREPSKASKAYKDMRETLRNEPELFVDFNSGITIGNNRYVLDGGHSVLALQDARKEDSVDLKKVKIRVTYLNDLTKEQLIKCALGLNTKVTPELYGQKNLEGTWETIKKHLDKKYKDFIEFKPHTKPDAKFKVDWLVALLNGWTGQRGTPERSYASKGLLVRLYSDDKYEKLLPYLNEAIEWYSQLATDLSKDSKITKLNGVKTRGTTHLPNGKKLDISLPHAYIWPIYSAYGEILDKETRGLDSDDIDILAIFKRYWRRCKADQVAQLISDYRKYAEKNPTKLGKLGQAYVNQMITVLR